MQQRARDRHVAVDPPKRGADRADRLRDTEAVLEQPVGVGLVVVLGRRRRAVARPQLAVLAEHALQQDPQVRLLDRAQQLADLAFHLLDAARRPVEQVRRVEAPRGRRLEPAQVDLRAEARMHGVAAADPHGRARARELLDLAQRLPDHARNGARAIAQLQAQVVAAVAPLPALGLADQQHLVDLDAVCQLVQEHGLKVDGGADGTLPARRLQAFTSAAAGEGCDARGDLAPGDASISPRASPERWDDAQAHAVPRVIHLGARLEGDMSRSVADYSSTYTARASRVFD